jgi:hypothetical protein
MYIKWLIVFVPVVENQDVTIADIGLQILTYA